MSYLKNTTDPLLKQKVRYKLLCLYDADNPDNQMNDEDDPTYQNILSNFERVQKVISSQNSALDAIDKKVTVL